MGQRKQILIAGLTVISGATAYYVDMQGPVGITAGLIVGFSALTLFISFFETSG